MIEYISQEASAVPFKDRRNVEKKTSPDHYRGIMTHRKMFEICRDEEGIRPGDIIVFLEWDGEKYTGGRTRREVTAVLHDCPRNGLMPGFCVVSLQVPGWDHYRPTACLDAEKEDIT